MAVFPGVAYADWVSGYVVPSRVRALAWRCLLAGLLALALTPAAAHAAYPAGFEQRAMIEGLNQPVAVAWAGSGRAFVAEKPGVLKTVAPGASTGSTVLDWRNKVNAYGDRGLEDVAVDSSFATNGFVYLAYVAELQPLTPDSSGAMVSQLVRIQVNPATGQLVPGQTPTVVLGTAASAPCPAPSNTSDCMPADSSTHMIGTVKSDPDGTLWVGHGDGADFGDIDPLAFRSLNPESLAGKVLHVDRDGKGLPGHAFCASDTDLSHVCTKVHAKGFRNPFRFQVRGDGTLLLGDVGWNTREEVNVVDAKGKSYGWPCYEGTIRTPTYQDDPQCAPYYAAGAETPPMHDYPHCPANPPPALECGNAVLAGPEYGGAAYPAGYRGSFFTGDYVSGKLLRFEPAAGGGYKPPVTFSDSWYGVDLEAAPDNGDLAYVDFGSGAGPDGSVVRISYTPGNRAPIAQGTATPPSGVAPLTVNFSGVGSSDPDGDQLSYAWDFGDGSAQQTGQTATHTYADSGSYTARLTVSDGRGRSATKTFAITSAGHEPVARIEAPTDGSSYRDGGNVSLRGSATDPEQGTLGAASLSWTVILHHGTHTHPLSSFDGQAEATFTANTDHDADSYYEIVLTATDAQGLTDTDRVNIRPQTTSVRIDSTPAGAPVSYGGRTASAPFTAPTAVGYRTSATAQAGFSSGGRPFLFDRWSDGPTANVRSVTVPDAGVALRALYLEDKSRGMAATASSTEDGDLAGRGAANAVDGQGTTRWSSGWADDQYWQVDLGRRRSVDRVQIDWEAAYASRYEIQTSLDGRSWSTAGQTTQSSAGSRTTTFATRVARYVRVVGRARGTTFGISFYEARVLGPADDAQPPDTTITSGPAGALPGTSASFGFAAGEAGSTFECKLDGDAWRACTSPKSYSSLPAGAHTFSVRATDVTGNADRTPAQRAFTVAGATPPAPAPPAGTPAQPKPGYAATVRRTRALRALFGLGDRGRRAADAKRGRPGRFHGSPRRARELIGSGQDGWARAFDGRNDRLELDRRSLGRTRAFSVELWVRAARSARTGYLLAAAANRSRDGVWLALDRRGRPVLGARGAKAPVRLLGPALGTSARHVALTYDGRRLRLYVDGRLRRRSVATKLVWARNRRVVVGADERGAHGFRGTLDELALYDRALPASTVAAHYRAGR